MSTLAKKIADLEKLRLEQHHLEEHIKELGREIVSDLGLKVERSPGRPLGQPGFGARTGPTAPKDPAVKAEALRIAETEGVRAASEATGIKTATIYNWISDAKNKPAPALARAALKAEPKGKRIKVTPELAKEITFMIKAGKTRGEIHKATGFSKTGVFAFAKRNNLRLFVGTPKPANVCNAVGLFTELGTARPVT